MNWYKKARDDEKEEFDPNITQREQNIETNILQSPTENELIPEKRSPYRWRYPKVRGGWTIDKIKKQLRQVSSSHGPNLFNTEIMGFSSPKEFEENLYYHGTGTSVSGGLKAGFRQVRNGIGGGGGYGENYYSISLSKDKNTASNFTADSRYGTVYPVILKKNAKIKYMPKIQDAIELEEVLPDLWGEGIDAVKIGNWQDKYSEQELVVLNPKAIHIGAGESFPVFQKQKFENLSQEEIVKMWSQSGDKYEQWLKENNRKSSYKNQKQLNNFQNNRNLFLNNKLV